MAKTVLYSITDARMALNMFRSGNDTVDIAKAMSLSESVVCNLLQRARYEQVHALDAERKAAGMMQGRR